MIILSPFSLRIKPQETFQFPISLGDGFFLFKINTKLAKNGIFLMNPIIENGDKILLKNINIPTFVFTKQRSILGDEWTVNINQGDEIGQLIKISNIVQL